MSIEALQKSHPAYTTSNEPAWLHGLRRSALQAFEETGFPGPRVEDWKYSNPRHIKKIEWSMSAQASVNPEAYSLEQADIELVFVNGRFDASLSRGLTNRVKPLSQAIESGEAEGRLAAFTGEKTQAFSALNLAFLQDGAWIDLQESQGPAGLIHILHLVDGQDDSSIHVRNRIQLGSCASAQVAESYVGLSKGSFTNAFTEIDLGSGAELVHCLWQRGDHGSKVGRVHVQQDQDSAYDGHSFWLGGAWVRNDIHVELGKPGAACSLNGLYLLDGKQHLDNHTTIDHQAPHCVSRELYKGVLGGRSTGVYNGMVKVQQEAQKTDSEQANHNILLSDSAQINTKPELEIYADDVKCAHGTTVGQLDAEALLYMRMRGIPKAEAMHILTGAFAQELLGELENPVLQESISTAVQKRLTSLKGDSDG
jgi:Fe-S cluster assembly protein SufD